MIDTLALFFKSAIVISLCLLSLVILYQQKPLPVSVFQLLVSAYILRCIAAIITEVGGTVFGQVDFYRFDGALWEAARLIRAGIMTAPLDVASQTGNIFYIPYIIVYSPVYVIFGHETMLARFFFALIGTLFVFNAYRLGKSIHTETTGLYTAGIATVFPYWVYLSTIFYRDMLVMLILTQILLVVIESDQSKIAYSMINVTGLSIASIMMRFENIVIIAVLIILYVYNLSSRIDQISRRVSVIITAPIVSVVSISITQQLTISIKNINTFINGIAKGSGAYLTSVIFPNWTSVLSFIPIGTVFFLFTPFPWQLHNTLALVAYLQNLIIWYPITFLAVLGFPYVYSRNRFIGITLVVFAISGIVPYGLIERNMGPALRHRSQFQIPFFVCAAVWIEERFRIKLSILDSNE